MIHISDESDFRSLLQERPIVIVDFYSTECPPCEQLAPIYERLSKQYGMIPFVKIFRQEHRELAQSYGVSGSPTILFFHRGELHEVRFSGEIREEDLKAQIDALLLKEEIAVTSTETPSFLEERDLCIIGMGPAGYTASIYAARYHVDHALVGELAGGLMTTSHKICNYPSESEISGMDLSEKMLDHVRHLEVPMHTASVRTVSKSGDRFDIALSDGTVIRAKAVLLASGTKHRHLNVEGEARLVGRGVSYCATCDAAFFKGKTVAVIGGSDSANTASLYLADMASHVYQIYRGSALRGETAWIDQIAKRENIEVLTETQVVKINGEQMVQSIDLDRPYNGQSILPIDGMFIEIGSDPDGRLIEQLGIETDGGYVKTAPDQRTSVPGVWAAGDITTNSDGFRQIVTACGEGAVAARSIFYALKHQSNE